MVLADAGTYSAPEPVGGVLFSLSYVTMPHHREVLRRAWRQLGTGRYLVIMDAKLPPGIRGRLLLPYAVWIMRWTVLGKPLLKPWEELRELATEFEFAEAFRGSYYVCRGRKRDSLE